MLSMYESTNGKRVITFSGLLAGMMAAWENTQEWNNAFELAEKLRVHIKPAYGYNGTLARQRPDDGSDIKISEICNEG